MRPNNQKDVDGYFRWKTPSLKHRAKNLGVKWEPFSTTYYSYGDAMAWYNKHGAFHESRGRKLTLFVKVDHMHNYNEVIHNQYNEDYKPELTLMNDVRKVIEA